MHYAASFADNAVQNLSSFKHKAPKVLHNQQKQKKMTTEKMKKNCKKINEKAKQQKEFITWTRSQKQFPLSPRYP